MSFSISINVLPKFPAGTTVTAYVTTRPDAMPEANVAPTNYPWLTTSGLSGVVDAGGNLAISGLSEATNYVLAGQPSGVWQYENLGRRNAVASSGATRIMLPADVANSTTTYADATGLSFAMDPNAVYRFKAVIDFTADLATTGSKWGALATGAINRLISLIQFTNTSTAIDVRTQIDNTPNVNASANSVAGTGNIVVIEGVVKNGGSANTFKIQFASEVGGGVITAKAGLSYLEYQAIA